jgi:hypothetical protein
MLDRPDGVAFVTVTGQAESLEQIRSQLEGLGGRGRGGPGRGAGRGGRGGGPGAGATPSLWQDVLNGRTSLIAAATSSAAVVQLMTLMQSYKNVKFVLFTTGDSAYEAIDALKGRNVRVILRPSIDLVPNTRDRFNAARMLHEAGIEFAFSQSARTPGAGAAAALAGLTGDADTTPDTPDSDFPLFPVAMLVKTGLPRQAALEALTKQPAAILGLDNTHGTIEPGKAAELLLFTGDPLDPASRLRLTLIDGRTVYAN